MRIAVVGCWHQGVVGAACLADAGHEVAGADEDAARVATLNSGHAPLYEPGLDELVLKGLSSGRLHFTDRLEDAVTGCPFVLVMFDTPVDEDDRSDLSGIFRAVERVAPCLANNTVVLVTAQVPVGTCDQLAATIRAANPAVRFGLAYSPENLRLGQAIDRFRTPPLPVMGTDTPETFARLTELFAPLSTSWQRTDIRTAEMTKHALNAFLAVSVCFANELGNLCDEVGADGQRLAQLLRLEPRIGSKAMLYPGLGFSGGTLARDMQTLRTLGDTAGIDTQLLDGAWQSNIQQNQLVIRKLRTVYPDLNGIRVAVLGLTYKPDTSTLRRSAAIDIIADLVRHGAQVAAHDPKADRAEIARQSTFVFSESPYDAVKDAHALVIVTGWPEYKALDFGRVKGLMKGNLLLDTNNMLAADRLQAMGFTYLDIGRGRKG